MNFAVCSSNKPKNRARFCADYELEVRKEYFRYHTDSMENSHSLEANSRSACQEVPCLLWNPKVRYRVRKSPSLVLILSQMNPVHTFPPSSITSTLILHSKWSLPFTVSNQNAKCISCLSDPCYMPCPSHLPLFHHTLYI
jgi:hypothetical protein